MTMAIKNKKIVMMTTSLIMPMLMNLEYYILHMAADFVFIRSLKVVLQA